MEKIEKTFWLARDKDGELNLFTQKPIFDESPGFKPGWDMCYDDENEFYDSIELDSHLYPEITFENSPVEVKLVKM